MSGGTTYARARVSEVVGSSARALLWSGAVGAAVGALLPLQVHALREPRAVIGGAVLLLLAALPAALHKSRWIAARAGEAERAGLAVTLEPPALTRQRMRRRNVLPGLAVVLVAGVSGLAAGPALGLLVLGLGLGTAFRAWRIGRQDRAAGRALWCAVADGRLLLTRRARLSGFTVTGPAAGTVRPLVRR